MKTTTAGGLALAFCLVFGCAGPTTELDDLRSQAHRSAGSAVSELETLQIAVDTQLRGNAWWRYTDVVVTDSETALSSIESTFSSRQPPTPEAVTIRDTTVTALSTAVDLASSTRIAVRQHDTDQLQQLLPELEDASQRLSELETRYE